MALKKIILPIVLLFSTYTFTHDTAEIVTPANTAVTTDDQAGMSNEIRTAFALETLLKDDNIKVVYESLSGEQKMRFEGMMYEISALLDHAMNHVSGHANKITEEYKDITEAFSNVFGGKKRFVLSAGFGFQETEAAKAVEVEAPVEMPAPALELLEAPVATIVETMPVIIEEDIVPVVQAEQIVKSVELLEEPTLEVIEEADEEDANEITVDEVDASEVD